MEIEIIYDEDGKPITVVVREKDITVFAPISETSVVAGMFSFEMQKVEEQMFKHVDSEARKCLQMEGR